MSDRGTIQKGNLCDTNNTDTVIPEIVRKNEPIILESLLHGGLFDEELVVGSAVEGLAVGSAVEGLVVVPKRSSLLQMFCNIHRIIKSATC